MTYDDAIRFLFDLRLHGLKLGLENTRRLAESAGNPQAGLRFIHVAGTNGKGSTCAMLESIYRHAGLRVGLFTSPHLVSFRERMQVNRAWISEAEVARGVDAMRGLLADFPPEHSPTFFETVTVLALRYFAGQGCDLVLWETGMGGRLDATNIVVPLASLITNIQLDHQAWLGSTHAEIAREKAGIIKPGVPVLTAADEPEALAVIREVADAHAAPLQVLTGHSKAGDLLPDDWVVPLAGEHQRYNAALALACVEVLHPQIPVEPSVRRRGLEAVTWPGRMQRVHRPAGPEFLLDGAHNLAGFEALVRTLRTDYDGRAVTWILGVLRDKDWEAVSALAARNGRRVLVVPVRSERSAEPGELAAAARQAAPDTPVECCADLGSALARISGESLVVVAGSLYLVGEAMELLGLVPQPAGSERELNEWSSVKTL